MTNAKNKKQVVKEKKKKTKARTRQKAVRVAPYVPGRYATDLYRAHKTNALALSISNPADNAVVRFPTEDMSRSSVAAFKYQHQISVTQTTGNTPVTGFEDYSVLVALTGQPGLTHSVLCTTPTASRQSLRFKYIDESLAMLADEWNLVQAPLPEGEHAIDGRANFAYPTYNGAGPRGADYVPIGEADGKSYFFMNKGDVLVILPSAAGTVDTFAGILDVQVVRHATQTDGEEPVEQKAVSLFAGAVVPAILWTAADAGFYSVKAIGVNFGGIMNFLRVVLEVQRNTTTYGWIHRPCYDLYKGSNGDAEIGRNVRCNATSLLLSNTTAALTRAGTILAGRLMGQDIWNLQYSALENCAEKYSGPAAHGSYTFMEFTKPREDFLSVCEGLASDTPRVMLGRKDFVHVVYITSPTGTTNTYNATLATHVEFKTDVARYMKGVAEHSFGDLLQARALINSNPEWFYENPSHMEQIYQFLRSGASAARKHARPLSALASSVDPARAPLYALLAQLLGK